MNTNETRPMSFPFFPYPNFPFLPKGSSGSDGSPPSLLPTHHLPADTAAAEHNNPFIKLERRPPPVPASAAFPSPQSSPASPPPPPTSHAAGGVGPAVTAAGSLDLSRKSEQSKSDENDNFAGSGPNSPAYSGRVMFNIFNKCSE